jgi:hypothetical protein
LSQGGLEALLKRDYSAEETDITRFRKIVDSNTEMIHEVITYNYWLIFGVRKAGKTM